MGEHIVQRGRLRRKGGTEFIGEIGGLRMADGRYQAVIRNVTDRVLMETALRESESHYRAIVELPFAQICRWLPDTTLTYVNDAYARAYGSSPQALVGTRWIRFVPEEARNDVMRTYQELMRTPHIYTYEHQVVESDGNTHWILWTDYPIVDNTGLVVEFQSLGQDITERRLAEQRLYMLSRAIDQSPASIVITNADGVIEYVNLTFEEVTGYSAAEAIGQNPSILKSGEAPEEDYRHLWATITSGQEWRGVFHNRRKNGELFWENATISPVFDESGRIVHYLAVKEDVTAKKNAEAALRKLTEELEARVEERTAELRIVNAALEQAARAKDEFLASMSHELRSPLSGILGASEGLQAEVYGPINDRQRRALHSIDVSGQHLLGLINDILDVAKVEAGQVVLQLDPMSAGDVCQASLQLVRGLAAKKHQRLSFSMEPTEIGMLADPRRLKQVLVNLLSNAVKFTAENGRIGLQVEGDEVAGQVRFTVWDTGIGISSQDLSRLFLPFTQLDSNLSREHTGTGLGLAS
ncbi:MAG: PAS domain S-box protein [Anaerolineales bacterium]|nr:PAS domain S-box protein [Anaerolineales bacterium]